MSRSSGRRAQVSPMAALVAVVAVGIGLSLYAGALDASTRPPDTGVEPTAGTVADRTVDVLAPAGVATPARLAELAGPSPRLHVVPAGYRLHATLAADGRRWRVGPSPPADVHRATRAVGVRVAPGRVVPGRLEVVIWS